MIQYWDSENTGLTQYGCAWEWHIPCKACLNEEKDDEFGDLAVGYVQTNPYSESIITIMITQYYAARNEWGLSKNKNKVALDWIDHQIIS